MAKQYDYIIVGAGSAGCVLANRLTADGRQRVLLLEAGPRDSNPWIHIPIGYAKTYYDPAVNWMYYTEPDPGTANRPSYWPRGKVLGGSSAINAMVFVRGQQADYDDWEASGAAGWGWHSVEPYFRKLESVGFTDAASRGRTGPISVSETHASAHGTNRHFLDGCVELGFAINEDFNSGSQEGVNYYQINTLHGRRVSSASGYLAPALARRNLDVICDAMVTSLEIAERTCSGVRVSWKGRELVFKARREVILSAGAINSPQILQLSGIGNGGHLRELGIDVKHHSPAVGENLQDHIGTSYFYRSRVPTLNDQFNSPLGCVHAGLQYLFARSGPLSISVNHSGGFVRSSPERERPNLQLYFQPTSYLDAVAGTRPAIRLDSYSAFNIGISQVRPTSRGSIRIASSDPLQAPVIRPNYLSTDYDVHEMVEGCRLIRKLVATRAMQEIVVDEILPGPDLNSDDELLEDFRNRSGTIFHPTCTCAMGNDPTSSVVSPDLKVHGIEKLRIADASVFPTVTSGNTNAPCMMVGEKAADLLLKNPS